MSYIRANHFKLLSVTLIALPVCRYILSSKLLRVIMPATWIIETPESVAAPAVRVEPLEAAVYVSLTL
jgi:hypothetical protein